MDQYIYEQVENGNFVEINPSEARLNHQLHFIGYNFVVSSTSSSTKVRMTTDSSMRTESELSLNRVTKPAPGVVPSLRGILLQSRCHVYYSVFDIKKFFHSIRIADRDSYLRIISVPLPSFSSKPTPNPSWIFYPDCSIPFGDSASGDYAVCAKAATVLTHLHDVPSELQDTVCQALLNGGVRADSLELLSELQDEIGKIINKGDFHIKAWESSGEEGYSKYLGMTWNRKDDRYLLKFRLNLHQKTCGIPSGEDLDSEFLLNKSLPFTKKNDLSVACQIYDPNGQATPLMVTIRVLFSEVYRDRGCSLQTHLSADRVDRFRSTVTEIPGTTGISFPQQIVFKNSGKLYIFIYGSLQGYGACIYMESQGQFNRLVSSAKIIGKASYSAPQSKIASAVLAVNMERKITPELSNITLSEPMFISDSEIVLKMIARNNPARLPMFYGTRIMEISDYLLLPTGIDVLDLLTLDIC